MFSVFVSLFLLWVEMVVSFVQISSRSRNFDRQSIHGAESSVPASDTDGTISVVFFPAILPI